MDLSSDAYFDSYEELNVSNIFRLLYVVLFISI